MALVASATGAGRLELLITSPPMQKELQLFFPPCSGMEKSRDKLNYFKERPNYFTGRHISGI